MKQSSPKSRSGDVFSMRPASSDRNSPEPDRYALQLPRPVEHHEVRLTTLRSGMSLLCNDFTLREDVSMPYEFGKGTVSFGVLVSGWLELKESSRRGRSVDVARPCETLTISDGCSGCVRIKGNVPLRCVGVYLNDSFWDRIVDGDEQLSSILEKVCRYGDTLPLKSSMASPQSQLIATQMLDCPAGGPCRRLYLESKSLELISTLLLAWGAESRTSSLSLTRGDIDRIHEAKRLLFQDMEEPPSLSALARRVGINETKLKKGFRKVFGCSAFQALRNHRIEVARAYLEDTDFTVGTVATMVGYTNMSHFIVAFRNKYGVTPGSLLRHSRHKSFK